MAAPKLSALNPLTPDLLSQPDAIIRRELYFFDLYRVFEAALLAGFCFSPLAERSIAFVSNTTARNIAVAYLVATLLLFLFGRRRRGYSGGLVFLGLTVDMLAATSSLTAIRGLDTGIATLLLVNVSCGALLLGPRAAYAYATIAALGVTAAMVVGADPGGTSPWLTGAMFGASYLASTILLQVLRSHVSETQELVVRQETALGNLTQLNELIIRRMRTGVIVVDAGNLIHQINEAAWQLVGSPSHSRRELGDVAPELSRRLYHWRTSGRAESLPVALAEGMPEIIPRFVKLGGDGDDSTIIFLDDTSLLSRQAEQLTLTSLGRLSASIAHEIRNPLAAISYSVQLLAESEQIPEPDMRLVDIIRAQCQRVNAIVENILQLSRRERSKPEPVDLGQWALNFVEEYKSTHPMESDDVRAAVPTRKVIALADTGQLQQIVWNLVQNARRYGRLPNEPARVTVVARHLAENGPPVIEVVDRGPGIPKRVADQIFDPFYTTNEHGTGLGLYIARQLCEANQGALEYVPVAGGGSCFRITLPASSSATRAAESMARRGAA